jgi:hypothetical protein
MKNQIINWLIGGGALWLFSASVHALPAPGPMDSKAYTFLYNFVQTLGANLSKIGEKS